VEEAAMQPEPLRDARSEVDDLANGARAVIGRAMKPFSWNDGSAVGQFCPDFRSS
jgi:hypothetical protein